MNRTLKVVMGLIVLLSAEVAAAKLVYYGFAERVRKAQVILVGTVSEVERYLAGSDVATVQVEELLKGEVGAGTVRVAFGGIKITIKEDFTDLVPGSRYVLFLRKNEHDVSYWIVGAGGGCYTVLPSNKLLDDEIATLDDLKQLIRKHGEVKISP